MAIAGPCNRSLTRARAAHAARAVLICLLAGAAAWASARHHREFDLTDGARHTLATASVRVLAGLPGTVTATAYVADLPALRERVRELFARYQRHRRDLQLHFVDPGDVPEAVAGLGLRDGEIVLRLAGRTEVVKDYSEQAVTSALARLARTGEQWVAFVTGHGERHPTGTANHDVSRWVRTLNERGLRTGLVNLAATGVVPDNTALLVLASPQIAPLAGETAALAAYLERGGNLLWLTEPDAPAALAPLARTVGVERVAGTVVDPLTQVLGIDNPAIAVVNTYTSHAAVSGFRVLTLLPYATAIREHAGDGWKATTLFSSGAKAWSETGPLDGHVAADPGADVAGPLALAVAFSRGQAVAGNSRREQRVVVVGDGDFLSNAYIDNGGNRDLGVRLVEWLVGEDGLVTVSSRPGSDTDLVLSRVQGIAMSVGFLFVLPLAFAANGLLVWWQRRNA